MKDEYRNCVSVQDQTMEIPAGFFISKVDLDDVDPFCIAREKDCLSSDEGLKIFIPKGLAYYMRRHFCGSQSMHDALIEDGRRDVRNKIKTALGI